VALRLALDHARARGAALLVTGSHYLLGYASRVMSESGNMPVEG
jgi:hypothetical protein